MSLSAPELGERDIAQGVADEAGVLRFPRLAAHVPYRLVVADGAQAPRSTPVEALWPREERVAKVVLGDPVVALELSVVDGAGRPLAERDFLLYGRACTHIERSDARGALRFELDGRFADRPLLGISIQLLDERGYRTHVETALDSVIPRLGENALGELMLDETPVIVAGTIKGAAPDLHDVQLAVEVHVDGGWRGVEGAGVYPLGAQAFELRGRLEPGAYRLVVTAPYCLPNEPLEFRLGERELALVLQPGGSLSAAVDGSAAIAAELVPEGSAAPGPVRGRRIGRRSRDGMLRFRWSGLPAGSYTLRLFDPDDEDMPLRELYGLEVEPGGVAGDPRLERIVLATRTGATR